MAYCVKCGAKVDDGIRFCPQCGAEIPQMGNQGGYTKSNTSGDTGNYTYYGGSFDAGVQNGYFDTAEVKGNKGMGVLSYIGILVLIPLLAGNRNSDYVKHHVNQGLVLFVLSSIVDLLSGNWVWGLYSWINFGAGWFSWLFDIADFACLILMVMGIVSACKGTRRELPLIGRIKVFK